MEKSHLLYIGGYSETGNKSLHVFNVMADKTEKLWSYEIPNASYLCFSPDGNYIYACMEVDNYKGMAGGGVAAFALEQAGQLRYVNDAFSGGGSPCHLSVSADGKTLYAANYSGGSTAVFDISGGIGNMKHLIEHKNFGMPTKAVSGRQENPYAHFVKPVTVNGITTVWACDLGLDAVLVFDIDGRELARYQAPHGFGPRHISFHPTKPIAYLVGEFACAVVALEFSQDSSLSIRASDEVKVINDTPKDTCAAIRVAPGERHLLVSNRRAGDVGSISVLGLDESGGVTELLHVVRSGGICPRDFAFSPARRHVFVANQDSGRVNVFDWSDMGELTQTDVAIEVPKPTCVLV